MVAKVQMRYSNSTLLNRYFSQHILKQSIVVTSDIYRHSEMCLFAAFLFLMLIFTKAFMSFRSYISIFRSGDAG